MHVRPVLSQLPLYIFGIMERDPGVPAGRRTACPDRSGTSYKGVSSPSRPSGRFCPLERSRVLSGRSKSDSGPHAFLRTCAQWGRPQQSRGRRGPRSISPNSLRYGALIQSDPSFHQSGSVLLFRIDADLNPDPFADQSIGEIPQGFGIPKPRNAFHKVRADQCADLVTLPDEFNDVCP